jgi:hypothetical protein
MHEIPCSESIGMNVFHCRVNIFRIKIDTKLNEANTNNKAKERYTMPIFFNQLNESDAKRFRSTHWVHTEAPNDVHLVTLTGNAIIDFKGTGRNWLRDRLYLTLGFPHAIIPSDKWFQIEHWAPFITLNAIANNGTAEYAGWAIDEFGGPGPESKNKIIRTFVQIWADVAVRDVDGYLFRVGYSLTVSGKFTDPPSPIDD